MISAAKNFKSKLGVKNNFCLWVMGLLTLLILIYPSTTVRGDSKAKSAPVAMDGVLDLSEWDFVEDGPVELRGEWRFVWQELVQPAE